MFGDGREAEGFPRQHILYNPNVATARGFHAGPSHGHPSHHAHGHEFSFQRDRPARPTTMPIPSRHHDRRGMPEVSPTSNLQAATSRLNAQIQASTTPTATPRVPRVQVQRHNRNVADVLPIVESSASPSPIDTPGHVSATASDNGAGFFRTYHERPSTGVSPRGNGALTPDLNYAEIGHGRGTQNQGGSTTRGHPMTRDRTPRQAPMARLPHPIQPRLEAHTPSDSEEAMQDVIHNTPIFVPQTTPAWTFHEPLLAPPVNRELHESVQMAFAGENRGRQEQSSSRESVSHPRSRSVKRSIKNTLHAAEHYASSLFGRSSGDVRHDGGDANTSYAGPSGSNHGTRSR